MKDVPAVIGFAAVRDCRKMTAATAACGSAAVAAVYILPLLPRRSGNNSTPVASPRTTTNTLSNLTTSRAQRDAVPWTATVVEVEKSHADPHKKHGRRAWSLFALGLNTLRKISVAASPDQIIAFLAQLLSPKLPVKPLLSLAF